MSDLGGGTKIEPPRLPAFGVLERAVATFQRANEDRVLVIDREEVVLVAVADGAGGRTGGALAADAWMDAVRAHAKVTRDFFDVRGWADGLSKVDHELLERGETTAIVMAVSTYAIMGVSVGDSEAWVLDQTSTPDTIERLTKSQSTARLGSGRAKPIPFHRRGLRKEELVLVATDGLFKHASRNRIFSECRNQPPESLDALTSRLVNLPTLANRFHPDDVALAVVRYR